MTSTAPATPRRIFDDEHQDFRESLRRFLAAEIAPHYEAWDADGIVPRTAYASAGEHGFLGMAIPESHGGAGVTDFRFNQIVNEEVQRASVGGFGLGLTLQNDVCLPYFLEYCTDEQRDRWLPGLAAGALISAIAMTEPEAGSDLAALRTSARRDGDCYVVNGAKTFITNGINADLVITAVRTDATAKHHGISLLVIERGMDGFSRGRNLHKIGMHAQDTAELFFDDVRVPVENLLGEEGRGFEYLMTNLAQERLSIAAASVGAAAAALEWTIDYVNERKAFGRPIAALQNTRFVLADAATEVEVGLTLVDSCVTDLNSGRLSAERAAMAKLWVTEMQGRVVDRCLQLFGGYGYMTEYPIARAYADARITRIYGGTNEVMREIVARTLRPRRRRELTHPGPSPRRDRPPDRPAARAALAAPIRAARPRSPGVRRRRHRHRGSHHAPYRPGHARLRGGRHAHRKRSCASDWIVVAGFGASTWSKACPMV
jgi:alkylation response protein AidB-like acyl-CoA dehydrogenase